MLRRDASEQLRQYSALNSHNHSLSQTTRDTPRRSPQTVPSPGLLRKPPELVSALVHFVVWSSVEHGFPFRPSEGAWRSTGSVSGIFGPFTASAVAPVPREQHFRPPYTDLGSFAVLCVIKESPRIPVTGLEKASLATVLRNDERQVRSCDGTS